MCVLAKSLWGQPGGEDVGVRGGGKDRNRVGAAAGRGPGGVGVGHT